LDQIGNRLNPSSSATRHFALVPSLPSVVPAWALVTGFTVSVAIGVFFGVWPAVKAAQLDPVDALRYE